MLNKPGLFGQNDRYRRDSRGLEPATPAPTESPRSEPIPAQTAALEVPKAEPVKAKMEEPMTKGSRLTVGPDIKLKGAEITDCDTLVVEGRVEASMDARVIQISESGSFHGTVGVDVAEIRGRFDGEMTARKQLIIHPGGKVTGKIHYGKIVIEEGGELSGDVGTISGAKSTAVSSPPKQAIQSASH
jgi:cytoskeletal protein CcmA (bactofilin family)